jgi:ribonuclease HI
MIEAMRTLFPEEGSKENIARIRLVANDAYILADEVYTAQDAENWGKGFSIPHEVVESDENLFKASMRNIEVMVNRRKENMKSIRLSEERIMATCRKDNPEISRLMLLAIKGMPISVRPGFVANGSGPLPLLRKSYKSVKSAVNKLLYENFHQEGLAFLLTKKTVLSSIPEVHFSPLSWTTKQGKRQGRPIGDCSDGGTQPSNEPLNSKYTKMESDKLWGVIEHPSIQDVAKMADHFYDEERRRNPAAKWKDVVMYKMDIKGAFTKIFFDAKDVKYLAMEMTEDIVILFFSGIFGWTGTPAAFQVVNRAIVHELRHVIQGEVLMYSDDIIVVCMTEKLHENMQRTKDICEGLLGPNAVETEKSEYGRVQTVIGYEINLDTRVVTISKRNILRTFYGFMTVNFDRPVTVKLMQKLASWASRYSNICSHMKPYVRVLYKEYAGRKEHVQFKLSETACRVIQLFRVLLGLTAVNELRFARTLDSFAEKTPTVIIEFDASLQGVGLLYYVLSANKEILIGGGSVDISSLEFGTDAAFQNTAEFTAAVLGIRGLKQLGLTKCSVELRGDSITALSWAESGRFKSDLVGNASSVFILQNIYLEVTINRVKHIAGKDNWRADLLSRKGTIRQLMEKDQLMGSFTQVQLNGDRIIQLCNPRNETNSEAEFISMWLQIRHVLESNT